MKFILLLFITFLSFGQNKTKAISSLKLAEIEFDKKNYGEAKKHFLDAVKNDTLNKDIWFNLGATQLLLGDTDDACVSFHRAYKRGDLEAFDYLENNCQLFGENRLTSIKYVDDVPKFKYKDDIFPLLEQGKLHHIYIDILKNQVIKSLDNAKINDRGTVNILVSIDKSGNFNGKVSIIKSSLSDEEKLSLSKDILRKVQQVEYIPATYRGENVETWEKWNQPIAF